MQITNNYSKAIGLPGGIVLQPGQPTPVHNWENIRKSAVVQAWLKAKVLTEGDAPKSALTSSTPADRDELKNQLDAMGVKYDKRAGVAKLQKLLEDAQSEATVKNTGDSEPDSVTANLKG